MPKTKQIYDLTLADLHECPIWLFLPECDDGAEDEASVRSCPPDEFDFETIFVARAEFELANGTRYEGYVSPAASVSEAQPCLFIGTEAISFWGGICAPDAEYIAGVYRLLDASADAVFPIRWRTDYPGPSSPSTGTIEGFGHVAADGDKYLR